MCHIIVSFQENDFPPSMCPQISKSITNPLYGTLLEEPAHHLKPILEKEAIYDAVSIAIACVADSWGRGGVSCRALTLAVQILSLDLNAAATWKD